jgi:hypothetical protein
MSLDIPMHFQLPLLPFVEGKDHPAISKELMKSGKVKDPPPWKGVPCPVELSDGWVYR